MGVALTRKYSTSKPAGPSTSNHPSPSAGTRYVWPGAIRLSPSSALAPGNSVAMPPVVPLSTTYRYPAILLVNWKRRISPVSKTLFGGVLSIRVPSFLSTLIPIRFEGGSAFCAGEAASDTATDMRSVAPMHAPQAAFKRTKRKPFRSPADLPHPPPIRGRLSDPAYRPRQSQFSDFVGSLYGRFTASPTFGGAAPS